MRQNTLKNCFWLILILNIPTFVISQNSFKNRLFFETGIGLMGHHGGGYDMYSPIGDKNKFLTLPIYAKAVFEESEYYEYAFETEFSAFRLRKSEPDRYDPYRHFVKLNLIALQRIWLLKKHRWIGLGVGTGSSQNLVREVNNTYSKRISSYERFMNTPPLALQLKWQERSRNLIHSFNIDYYLFEFKGREFEWDLKNYPLYFSYKLGRRFFHKKAKTDIPKPLFETDIAIDSFYSKWNISFGFEANMPLNMQAEGTTVPGFIEARYRTSEKYAFGFHYVDNNGSDFGNENLLQPEDENRKLYGTIISRVRSYGVTIDRFITTKKTDYFIGIRLARYKMYEVKEVIKNQPIRLSDPKTIFPKASNRGLAIRSGYQIGRFRHTLSLHLTGFGIPTYISSSFGINFGFSQYYR